MPFIGQEPQIGAYHVLDSITASATATYNLQLNGGAFSPASANHLLVSLNGVLQKPGASFNVSGSQITFSSALTSSDNINFIMALGNVLDVGTPTDGSVNTGKLAASAVTIAKIAGSGTRDNTTFLRGDGTFAEAGGGKVLQIVHATLGTTSSHVVTANNFVDTPMTASITPSATSSKILVMGQFLSGGAGGNLPNALRVKQAISGGATTEFKKLGHLNRVNNMENNCTPVVCNFLSTTNTTSAVTYTVQITRVANGTIYFNGTYQSGNNDTFESHMTLVEIGA